MKFCADCQKELVGFYAKRCRSCNAQYLVKSGKICKKGENSPNYKHGKPKCIDCGNQLSNYNNKRCHSCSNKSKWKNKTYRNRTMISMKLANNLISSKTKKSDNLKLRWKNKKYITFMKKLMATSEYKTKVMKGIRNSSNSLKPNKPEIILRDILNELFENNYKFVGDFSFIIGGFCPDFINVNGQKKIIELYGDYWHNRPDYKKRDKKRIKIYNSNGYKTLIVWQKELQNIDKLKQKLITFNTN